MARILLDRRENHGGVGRYGRVLEEGLAARPDVVLATIHAGTGLTSLLRRPYTPWGRAYVRVAAKRSAVELIHSPHLELPPRLPGVRSVVTIQDLIPLEYPASMPSRLKRM